MNICSFDDFTKVLLNVGFSMGGGNDEGIYSVIPFSWNEASPYDTPVRWHTGDPDTDPWEWRMRVLEERDDIAYSKLFFSKSGYISKEWYPYFLAVRRQGFHFEDEYYAGKISQQAKRIYDVIREKISIPSHAIKQLAGFSKEDKTKVDSAMTELQMKMYITICGRQRRISNRGDEFGWSSDVFCTTEAFFDEAVFESAGKIYRQQAIDMITEQIYKLNPKADSKKIMKFICG